MTACLDDQTVLQFVQARLSEEERARIDRHIGGCATCSDRVAALAADLIPTQTPSSGPQPSAPGDPQSTAPRREDDDDRPLGHPQSLARGTVLGQTYRILRFIGRGGMGEVYEVSHARLTGRYAVKVLHPHCVANPRIFRRFRREAEITSGLRHPNIVQVIDFDHTPQGSPFLVMELLDGPELAKVIAEQAPMAPERVLSLVDQIASALSAVHAHGIVHRDLKPQNIFLLPTDDGRRELVKLVDFGISKVRQPSLALTAERAILGTPQYMAPEQAGPNSEAVDARADQFALAVMVYQMLSGKLPFPGARMEIVVYRLLHEDPAPLTPQVSASVDAVLRRALSKNPEDRFTDVHDFASALRAAATDTRIGYAEPISPRESPTAHDRVAVLPVSGTEPTSMAEATISRARRRAGRIAAVAAGLALAVGLALLLRPDREAPPSSARSQDPRGTVQLSGPRPHVATEPTVPSAPLGTTGSTSRPLAERTPPAPNDTPPGPPAAAGTSATRQTARPSQPGAGGPGAGAGADGHGVVRRRLRRTLDIPPRTPAPPADAAPGSLDVAPAGKDRSGVQTDRGSLIDSL